MLTLPSVTLLTIDCMNPRRALRSLLFSRRQVQFAEVVFVTDCHDEQVRGICEYHGVKMIHDVTGSRHDFEYNMLQRTPDYFKTSHVLYQEWDSAVMNALAWNPAWLEYDYIGAPWPTGSQEERWWSDEKHRPDPRLQAPKVTGPENCVGNGGFSLKSSVLCRKIAANVDRMNPHQLCSDAWICRTLIPKLRGTGHQITVAPESEASRFSCENRFYAGQFGMHGKNTIRMNNWDWEKALDWV